MKSPGVYEGINFFNLLVFLGIATYILMSCVFQLLTIASSQLQVAMEKVASPLLTTLVQSVRRGH